MQTRQTQRSKKVFSRFFARTLFFMIIQQHNDLSCAKLWFSEKRARETKNYLRITIFFELNLYSEQFWNVVHTENPTKNSNKFIDIFCWWKYLLWSCSIRMNCIFPVQFEISALLKIYVSSLMHFSEKLLSDSLYFTTSQICSLQTMRKVLKRTNDLKCYCISISTEFWYVPP